MRTQGSRQRAQAAGDGQGQTATATWTWGLGVTSAPGAALMGGAEGDWVYVTLEPREGVQGGVLLSSDFSLIGFSFLWEPGRQCSFQGFGGPAPGLEGADRLGWGINSCWLL